MATSAAAHDAADEAAENEEPGNDAPGDDEAASGTGKLVPPVVIRRAADTSAPAGSALPIVVAGLASTAVVVGRPVVAVGVKNP